LIYPDVIRIHLNILVLHTCVSVEIHNIVCFINDGRVVRRTFYLRAQPVIVGFFYYVFFISSWFYSQQFLVPDRIELNDRIGYRFCIVIFAIFISTHNICCKKDLKKKKQANRFQNRFRIVFLQIQLTAFISVQT